MRTGFKGTGPMESFVESSNEVFAALMSPVVKMPAGYVGVPPSFEVSEGDDGGAIKLNMNDALFLDLNYVDISGVSDSGGPAPPVVKLSAEGGQLVIEVNYGG